MSQRRGIVLFAIVLVVAGCGLLERRSGLYPDACADLGFPRYQCDAIVAAAMDQAGVEESNVGAIRFVPFESEANLGGHQIARVAFEQVDGKEVTQDIWCVGVAMSPVCNPDAEIMIGVGVDHDVPCSGEAPGSCATLPPSPPPEAVAQARPLEIETLDIPIDREGHYAVEVGPATLPNGYLSERSMRIIDRRPTAFWSDFVRLEVRPDDPNRPAVGSVYREPFEGPEPVTVFVVFDVTRFEEPSTLQLRDIVVR